MARFIQHIIRDGDTLQGIAQQHLGDMSQWETLVQFNNLKYPYIVDTIEEKLTNPNHLVTIGDTVLIKVSNDIQSTLIEELRRSSEYDQEELFALALGKDLDILPAARKLSDKGNDFEVLAMKGNRKGGIATVRGLDNLKQSLFIRLITPQGSYVGHPTYGSRLFKYLGNKNTEENATMIDIEIERTLRTDARVTRCELLERSISGTQYSASFSISTYTLEEAFEFVISARQSGIVALLDTYNDLNT
jgi:phage baseplate assembly protein W